MSVGDWCDFTTIGDDEAYFLQSASCAPRPPPTPAPVTRAEMIAASVSNPHKLQPKGGFFD